MANHPIQGTRFGAFPTQGVSTLQENPLDIQGGEAVEQIIASMIEAQKTQQQTTTGLLGQIQHAGMPTTFDKVRQGLTGLAAILDLTSGRRGRRRGAPEKFRAARGRAREDIERRAGRKRQTLRDKLALEEIFGKGQANIFQAQLAQAGLEQRADIAEAGFRAGAKSDAARIEAAKITAKAANRKTVFAKFDKDIEGINRQISSRSDNIRKQAIANVNDDDVAEVVQRTGVSFTQAKSNLQNQEFDRLSAQDDGLAQLRQFLQLTQLSKQAFAENRSVEDILREITPPTIERDVEDQAAKGLFPNIPSAELFPTDLMNVLSTLSGVGRGPTTKQGIPIPGFGPDESQFPIIDLLNLNK